MKVEELSIGFDLLYNNISNVVAQGLTEFEKSQFLTWAQEEIIKNYFNINSNKNKEGLNNSIKRDTDFSTLFKTISLSTGDITKPTPINNPINSKLTRFTFNADYLFILNEVCDLVKKDNNQNIIDRITTTVVPIHYMEYSRLMSAPYSEPKLHQTWRLIGDQLVANKTVFDLITRFGWIIEDYTIRYIKKPTPIILTNLPTGVTINGVNTKSECLLNEVLHQEILDRAVELAKVTSTSETAEIININNRNE